MVKASEVKAKLDTHEAVCAERQITLNVGLRYRNIIGD
jgi:hypothetical protein